MVRNQPARKAAAKPRELSERERRFVEAYVIDGNGTKAARVAGYVGGDATLAVQAQRLLRRAKVQAALAKITGKATAKAEITVERIMAELAILAFSDVRHFAVSDTGQLELTDGAPENAWRAVSSVKHRVTTTRSGDTLREVEYRLWSKTDALQMAGKHLGMFMERSLNIDLASLTDDQVAAIARGEDPLAVIARTPRGS